MSASRAARATLAARMEILALLVWLLVAGMGLVLLPFSITTPGVALAAIGSQIGLVAGILFVALDEPDWAMWVQVGAAVLGILGAGIGVKWICDESFATGSAAEEVQAGVLGLQLPFYFVVAFLTLVVAFGGADPVL
jgi:hypothetical protein